MVRKRLKKDVNVVVLPGMNGIAPPATEKRKFVQLVKNTLLRNAKESYHKVQVEVERSPDGKPTALLASMLRARTYTADIVRVTLDAKGRAEAVERLTPPDPE